MSTVGGRSTGIAGRVHARLWRVTGLLIGIGIDIGQCWKDGRESRATAEDWEKAWDTGADDTGVDFGEAPQSWEGVSKC